MRSQSLRYISLGLNKRVKKCTYFQNANELTHTVERHSLQQWESFHFVFYEFLSTSLYFFLDFVIFLQNIKDYLNVLMN